MLRAKPINLRIANEFIVKHHRHHGFVQGCKFTFGVLDDSGALRGVLVAGRPVSRHLDDGLTSEITRCATDGVRNGCSFLYQRASAIARVMGYTSIITYILDEETGSSLKGAGWRFVGSRGGGDWSRPTRPRTYRGPTQKKQLWVDANSLF